MSGLFLFRSMGRPTTYTTDRADEICDRLADGESLRSICAAAEMPDRVTVFRWLRQNEDFRIQYAHAREAQADALADEIVGIADDGQNDTYKDDEGNVRVDQDVIARSRLRVDARKWVAAKLKPKAYGEKISTEHSGGLHVTTTDLTDEQLAAIAAAGSH